jgi:hypothetical protein
VGGPGFVGGGRRVRIAGFAPRPRSPYRILRIVPWVRRGTPRRPWRSPWLPTARHTRPGRSRGRRHGSGRIDPCAPQAEEPGPIAAPRAPKPPPQHHLPRAGRRLRSAADGPASPHRPPGRASDPAVTAPAAPTRTLTKPASTAHRGTTSPKTTAPALRTPGRAPELSRVRPGGQGSDRIEPCARARRRHTAPRPPHRPRGRASDSAVTGPAGPVPKTGHRPRRRSQPVLTTTVFAALSCRPCL